MSGYALQFTDPTGATAAAVLGDLDELPLRVALEQLAHELNPVHPDGYVVSFTATTTTADKSEAGSLGRSAAGGHFYVRPAEMRRPQA